jgi:type VI secretion system protein ImpL
MNTPPRPSIPNVVILGGVSLAVIVTGLWAAYKYWSPDNAVKIGTLLAVLLGALIIVLLVIWLVWKVAIWLRESRASRQEAESRRPRPGATPEDEETLDTMQERLNAAVQVLRESKLARGRSAEEALYTLPWILLLGPSESGKTSVLRACGVDFPYTTLEMRKSHRGGQMATCEYWFSRGAVVLDLAGKYAAGSETVEVFGGFLDQLKRARKTRPLDGVVVAVSVREILDKSPEETERLANQLRQRFDLMIRRLGIRFPIYVLFTRCDQVEGFKEFFGNLRSRDRGQIWGATISRAQRRRYPAEQLFEQEFDRLVEGLNSQRLQLLASESDSYKLAQIFTFPARFGAVRERLSRFLGTLLEPTPYSERPMFRGFYLSSAAGAASVPESRKVQEAAQRWEPGARRAAAVDEPAGEARSFFLEELFPKVIFADRPMATASVDTRLRRRLRHDVALVATVVISLLLTVLFSVSFIKNSSLLESTKAVAARTSEPGWDGRSVEGLRSLEQLRKQVAELDTHEVEGAPLSLRWGLYSGDDVRNPSRRLYYRLLRSSFVTPVAENIRQKLYSMSTRSQGVSYYDFYNQLKTYLMMTHEGSEPAPDETFLNSNLEPVWKGLSPRDMEGSLLSVAQLRFYSRQVAGKEQNLILQRDQDAVERSRQALRRYSLLERVYTSLKNEGNLKLKPLTLDLATGGKSDYLTSTREVPGIFTEAGWSSYFRDAIGQASKKVMQNDWVVGGADTGLSLVQAPDAGYETKMREWYFNEYAEEWVKFLEGVSIRPFNDLADSKAALDSLSMAEYSLSRLLLSVAQNTMLPREPRPAGAPAAPVARPDRASLVDAVASKFAPLHEVATSLDGKLPSVISQYADILGRLRSQLQLLVEAGGQWDQVKGYVARVSGSLSGDEFHDAYRVTQRVRQTCGTSRYTNPVPSLLELPLRYAWTTLLKDMGTQVDTRWKSQVADAYRREVEGLFPFNPAGQDLPLPTLSKYFRPADGLLWSFYDKELKSLLVTPETAASSSMFAIRLAPSREFQEFMERAGSVREAFYGPAGAEPTVMFDITPEGSEDVTESILEIDGQPPLRYRNELPSPQTFSWPGKPGPPQARLSIAITRSAERPNIPAITGDWAFFRLLGRARIDAQSLNSYAVVWSPPASDTRRFSVKYRLQARSATNPFRPAFFRGIRCPDRVTQGP